VLGSGSIARTGFPTPMRHPHTPQSIAWPHMPCSAQHHMAAPAGRPAELRVPSDMPMHLSSVLIRPLEKGPGQRLSSHA
jgi:hypothetical protein